MVPGEELGVPGRGPFISGGWVTDGRTPKPALNMPVVPARRASAREPLRDGRAIQFRAESCRAIILKPAAAASASKTNRYPYRLANTDQSLKQLIHNDKAILLQNALIDTASRDEFGDSGGLAGLRAGNGTYVVQSRGALDDPFPRGVAQCGRGDYFLHSQQRVSRARVRLGGAAALGQSADPERAAAFTAVLQLDPSLLKMAIEQPDAVPGEWVERDGCFPDA